MIFILLPAYNEEASLPLLLPKLKQVLDEFEPYKVIVCNDGSTDSTPELLKDFSKEMPLEVINHKMNRGLGETCRDLFERAAEISNMDDIIIRLDCDNTHEPEILINIVQKLRAGYDVVVASRFADGGGQLGVTRYRTTISFLANIFMKVFFPIPGLREYSCGFRGYTAAIVKKSIDVFGNDLIQLKGLGFTCTLEKLIKMALLGAKVTEVPFILRYDQKLSSSKMVSSITTLGYFVMVILYNWPWGGWKSAVKNKSLIERN